MVKNPLAKQEPPLQSLGPKDPLEKEMTTHTSILAWEIPWTEEPGGLQSMGPLRVRHNLATECAWPRAHTHTHTQGVAGVSLRGSDVLRPFAGN